jgi:hypothetical protein
MKRSILIGMFGVGSLVAAHAQGDVNFLNYFSSTQTSGISYGNGPAVGLGVGPEISVTLLYGLNTDTLISQLTAIPSSTIAAGLGIATGPAAIFTSMTGAGWFNSGSVFIPNLSGVSVAGGTYAFAIEATGTYLGNVYTGYSPIVLGTTTATIISPIPDIPTALLEGSFTVVVPEPTTLALGGLGLAGLLMARRKKA